MEIKTKFGIGDSFVWKDGRSAANRQVQTILIKESGIFYKTFTPHGSYYIEHPEKECFATKEECNLAIIEEIAGETRKE